MTRELAAIISDAATSLRPLLQEAFEAGRRVGHDEGRRDASEELRSRLSGIFEETSGQGKPEIHPAEAVRSPSAVVSDVERAPVGTVKPMVLKMLRENPSGLSVAELTARTGFKKNSVRGTLWGIKQDGDAERRGERWFAIAKERAAGLESEGAKSIDKADL